MPPSTRKPAAKPDEAKHAKADAEICRLCWPEGWPGDDNAATCEHGTYKR